LVSALVNRVTTSQALVDSGYLVYRIVSDRFVYRYQLSCVKIEPRHLQSVEGVPEDVVSRIVSFDLDIRGHRQRQPYAYVVHQIEGYEMILEKSWLRKERALLDAAKGCLVFQDSRLEVYSELEKSLYDHKPVTANVFGFPTARKRKLQVFIASLADISKALAEKKFTDL
jgi:hypothetical protein